MRALTAASSVRIIYGTRRDAAQPTRAQFLIAVPMVDREHGHPGVDAVVAQRQSARIGAYRRR
jgi:hypothetical protein